MVRRVRVPDPNDCKFEKPRFYVARYDPFDGEYWALCMQKPDFSAHIEYRDSLEHAMIDAQVFTDGGEQVNCIYECFDRSWTRHEFKPAEVDRGPEWGEW